MEIDSLLLVANVAFLLVTGGCFGLDIFQNSPKPRWTKSIYSELVLSYIQHLHIFSHMFNMLAVVVKKSVESCLLGPVYHGVHATMLLWE